MIHSYQTAIVGLAVVIFFLILQSKGKEVSAPDYIGIACFKNSCSTAVENCCCNRWPPPPLCNRLHPLALAYLSSLVPFCGHCQGTHSAPTQVPPALAAVCPAGQYWPVGHSNQWIHLYSLIPWTECPKAGFIQLLQGTKQTITQ